MKYLIKKMIFILMTIIFAGITFSDVTSAQRSEFNLEQAMGNPPEIVTYLNGKVVSDKAKYEASIPNSNKEFEMESIQNFKDSGEGIHYIILLDNSRSVNLEQFEQAKKEIAAMRKNLRKSDRMELYVVGNKSKRGNKSKIFSFNGNNKYLEKDIESIKKIERIENYTVLYRSITKELTNADNSRMRTVMILVTDGEDDSEGKDKEEYNVNPVVKCSKIPIYGILLQNVSSYTNIDKINNTKKNILNERYSRGYSSDCASIADVTKGFEQINRILFDETYIVKFRATDGSNKTISQTDCKLSVKIKKNGKMQEKVLDKKGAFSYLNSKKDKDFPKIKKVEKSTAKSIDVVIKDGTTRHLIGADNKDNYIVRTKTKDGDGEVWDVCDINIDEAKNTYTLTFDKKLYNGKYTIQCKNITDDSVEKNLISDKVVEFKVSDGVSKTGQIFRNIIKSYWWIAVIILVIAIGSIVIILVKKKQLNVIAGTDTNDLLESGTKIIGMTITDNNNLTHDISLKVEGSLFVGRTEICNIHFDDDKLSRQHFVIEVTKAACYIEDLQTTNSTFVNGVRITGRRMLSNGDVITAGRERFVFYELKLRSGE